MTTVLGTLDFEKLEGPSLSLVESLRAQPFGCSVSFVDIELGFLGQVRQFDFSGRVVASQLSLAEPLGQQRYLVAAGRHLGIVDSARAESWSIKLLPEGKRFNDGTIDSLGRLVVGSMNIRDNNKKARNRLFLLGSSGKLTTLRRDVGLSNGLGIDPLSGDLFHVDTLASTIHRLPLSRETGRYGAAELFHQFSQEESPDGIIVLNSGELLVALWGQSALALIGCDGREILRFSVPPVFPTSICICNSCGTLWMGSASQPREGADVSIQDGALWFTKTRLRQSRNYSWKPMDMRLVVRR